MGVRITAEICTDNARYTRGLWQTWTFDPCWYESPTPGVDGSYHDVQLAWGKYVRTEDDIRIRRSTCNNGGESVFVFLRDADSGDLSAGIQMTYTCMNNASNSHMFNYMGIGLTEVNKISGDQGATYSALATSSALYKDKRTEEIRGIINPYAYLSIEIAQQTDSLVTITEIDPFGIAEIFGQVGGFWDILMIFWPIFFVSSYTVEPHLKVRNFKKAVIKGAKHAMNITRQPILSTDEPRRRTESDERPPWECDISMPRNLETLAEATHRRKNEKNTQRHYFPAAGTTPAVGGAAHALPPTTDVKFQVPRSSMNTPEAFSGQAYSPSKLSDLSHSQSFQSVLSTVNTQRTAFPADVSRSIGVYGPEKGANVLNSKYSPTPKRHLRRAPHTYRDFSSFSGAAHQLVTHSDVGNRKSRSENIIAQTIIPSVIRESTTSRSAASSEHIPSAV